MIQEHYEPTVSWAFSSDSIRQTEGETLCELSDELVKHASVHLEPWALQRHSAVTATHRQAAERTVVTQSYRCLPLDMCDVHGGHRMIRLLTWLCEDHGVLCLQLQQEGRFQKAGGHVRTASSSGESVAFFVLWTFRDL